MGNLGVGEFAGYKGPGADSGKSWNSGGLSGRWKINGDTETPVN